MDQTPSQILGVPVGASADELKARFRFLSLAFHPDRYEEAHRQAAAEEFKRINEAYQALLSAAEPTPPPMPEVEVAQPTEEATEESSDEWTELDTVNMRNLARMFGRLVFVVMGCLILYATVKVYPNMDPAGLWVYRLISAYLFFMAFFVMKRAFIPPSPWIRIPAKISLWLVGSPMCFFAVGNLLHVGWSRNVGYMLGLSLVIMMVARFMYPLEPKLGWARVLFRVVVGLAWGTLLLASIEGMMVLFVLGCLLFAYWMLRDRGPKEAPTEAEEDEPEAKGSDFWKYAAGAAVGASAAAFARRAAERQAAESKRPAQKYCKFCGTGYSSVSSLTAFACSRHPRGSNQGKHQLYQGSEKARYECEYCGTEYSSIASLTAFTCSRHPTDPRRGKHSPAL